MAVGAAKGESRAGKKRWKGFERSEWCTAAQQEKQKLSRRRFQSLSNKTQGKEKDLPTEGMSHQAQYGKAGGEWQWENCHNPTVGTWVSSGSSQKQFSLRGTWHSLALWTLRFSEGGLSWDQNVNRFFSIGNNRVVTQKRPKNHLSIVT